jgi:outer membrane lipase/esterase
MWSQSLGAKFGVTVTPSDAPGGGNNYAAGMATVNTANGGTGNANNANAWSATQQVSAYLSSTGGVADPSALYTVYIGNNNLHSSYDLAGALPNLVDPVGTSGLTPTQQQSQISTLAGQTASLVQQLSAAGARYILVPNSITINSAAVAAALNYNAVATGAGGVAWTSLMPTNVQYYNSTMWNDIAAKGINFIPADFNNVANYVILNAAQFGITNTDLGNPLCGTSGGGGVISPNCTSANWTAGLTPYNTLFADYNGHLATAGQNIQADYAYGLIVAPVQVSMLANQASIGQIAMNTTYLDQVGYSVRKGAPQTLGAWALGGAQQVNTSGGQTSTSSSPYSGAAGMDYQLNENLLLGGFVGYGQVQVNYNNGGNFTQSGTTLGAYSGYKDGAVWANAMLAYNWMNNNVNRVTPIGITSFSNTSSVNGANTSAAIQTGYNFDYGLATHGPVIGYQYVNTGVNGFTESGNFNSLQFGSQNINAQVGSAGYQVQAKVGDWLPFAKAIYNSQLGNLDRNVTTTLTTVTAPSYTMPALSYGRNWTNLTAGVGYQIDPKTVVRASFTQQVAQQNVNSYSAMVSLNSHF